MLFQATTFVVICYTAVGNYYNGRLDRTILWCVLGEGRLFTLRPSTSISGQRDPCWVFCLLSVKYRQSLYIIRGLWTHFLRVSYLVLDVNIHLMLELRPQKEKFFSYCYKRTSLYINKMILKNSVKLYLSNRMWFS